MKTPEQIFNDKLTDLMFDLNSIKLETPSDSREAMLLSIAKDNCEKQAELMKWVLSTLKEYASQQREVSDDFDTKDDLYAAGYDGDM